MTEQHLALTRFYAGWDVFQRRLVAVIAPLTLAQLALRSSPQGWTVGAQVTHIVASRVWWFYTWMGEGSADLAPLALWDENAETLRPVAELVAGLEQSWQPIQATLDRRTPADLDLLFPPPPELNDPPRSRQWIIWHVLEHELMHGGEIAAILGTHGLATINA